MPSLTMIADLEAEISDVREAAGRFLQSCETDYELPDDLVPQAKSISARFYLPLVRLLSLVLQSPMLGDPDQSAIRLAIRQIDAALRLRRYQEWEAQVISDEDTLLGITPAGFSEDVRVRPSEAREQIDGALDQVARRLGILRAEAQAETNGEISAPRPALSSPTFEIRPGTAFMMMMIDPSKPELDDVKQVIQEVCAYFGITATRSDEIEHSGEITHRILDEIRTSEFLIADVTGERPSVYYEVGFAHAIGKRPILYRHAGTRLHFDLAVHNCPEYRNLTELREMLRRRLVAITRGE